jgi:hypothetical protein
MAWSSLTFSTLNTIANYEAEINNLAGAYTRATLTIESGGYLKSGDIVDIAGNMIAYYLDGSSETLTYVALSRYWVATTGGEAILITNSTGSIQFPCTAGDGDIYDLTGSHYFDLSICSDVAWNNTNVQSSWQNKCNLAKTQIGEEVKKQLANIGWRDYDVTSGEVLDYVQNTTCLVTPADYLTLHLIYVDLLATQPQNDAYKTKADYYRGRYQEKLQDAMYLLTFGTSTVNSYPLFTVQGTRLQV